MSLGSFYDRPLRPMCPHTVVRNGEVLHTCAEPMVEVASHVFECPNDHRGRKVRKRKPRLYPALPREKDGEANKPINAPPLVMHSPFHGEVRVPAGRDPVGAIAGKSKAAVS